jgi:hypothetical protein
MHRTERKRTMDMKRINAGTCAELDALFKSPGEE